MKKLFYLVFILAIAFVGVGFYRGWFTATPAEAGGKKSGITLNWDLAKLKADMSKLKVMSKSALEKIQNKAKAVSATESEIEGKVKGVDVANHTLTLDSDGHEIPLQVPDSVGIDQLVGKNVKVTLTKTGDTLVVSRIAEK